MLLNVEHGASSLLEKLLRQYLQKHGLRRKVLSSQSWMTSVTKNLNGEAVLTSKVFQMAAFPRCGTHGEPEGVFVNLGVNILAFQLLQAMYCQKYKKNCAKPVVHLRNNCTAAQTIVEFILHTSIPLAEIPLNGSSFQKGKTGTIMVYAPSPILNQLKHPFHLKFNEHFEANVFLQSIWLAACSAAAPARAARAA